MPKPPSKRQATNVTPQASTSAFPLVVKLPTSSTSPSNPQPAPTPTPAPPPTTTSTVQRPGHRKRKPRGPKHQDHVSDTSCEDNTSVLACIDDEAAGSTAAKRIAMLAKMDALTQPARMILDPPNAIPPLQSNGIVSRRAWNRAKETEKLTRSVSTRKADENTNEAALSTFRLPETIRDLTPKPMTPPVASKLPTRPLGITTNTPTHTTSATSLTLKPSPESSNDDKREICRTYRQLGACPFGTKCLNIHLLPDGRDVLSLSTPQKTLDEAEAEGQEICRRYWRTGFCPYGRRCVHEHVRARRAVKWDGIEPMPLVDRFADVDNKQEGTTSVVSSSTSPTLEEKVIPKETCKRFLAGKCTASKCPRLHFTPIPEAKPLPSSISPSATSPATTPAVTHSVTSSSSLARQPEPATSKPPRQVCRLFLAGRCKMKNGCNWSHESPVQPTATTAPSTKAETRPQSRNDAPVPTLISNPAPNLETTSTGGTSTKSSSTPTKEVCKKFVAGKCKNDKCPRLHPQATPEGATPKLTASAGGSQKPGGSFTSSGKASSSVSTSPRAHASGLTRVSSSSSGTAFTEFGWNEVHEHDWSEGVTELPEEPPDRYMTKEEEDYAWDTSSETNADVEAPRLHEADWARAGLPSHSAQPPRHDSTGGIPDTRPLCRLWARSNVCKYGTTCRFSHERRSLPAQSEICMLYLQNSCPNGDRCKLIHVQDHILPAMSTIHASAIMSLKVMDYTTVDFQSGFRIQSIRTAFDSGAILVQNVPYSINLEQATQVIQRHGTLVNCYWRENEEGASGKTLFACFVSYVDAARASANLNGAHIWNTTVSSRILANVGKSNGLINRWDATVRLTWDAPGRIGYAGYDSIEEADETVRRLNGIAHGDCVVEAVTYKGLPALGRANVRFWIPVGMSIDGFRRLARTKEVVLDQTSDSSLSTARHTLQCMAGEFGPMVSFRVLPPVFRARKVRAWIEYTSVTAAATAANAFNGLQLRCLGRYSLSAQQIMSLRYRLEPKEWIRLRDDLNEFQLSYGTSSDLASVQIVVKPDVIFVRLIASDPATLAPLKNTYERIVRGDVVKEAGEVVWDEFFKCSNGAAFIFGVEQANPGVMIRVDTVRRKILVAGRMSQRKSAIQELLNMVRLLRQDKTVAIPLSGNLVGLLMSQELVDLQKQFGVPNVVLNVAKRVLAIRGSDAAVETARLAILQASQKYPGTLPNVRECPACTNEVTQAVCLPCGHEWCHTCLTKYLAASTDNSLFPLSCFGANGTCAEPIPLPIARNLLPADQFEAISHAAFRAHIQARPHEFRHCPTTDCAQVYRPVPDGAVLSCPACLVRICGRCGQEQHDGTPCTSREADGQFAEWKEAHGVKPCPGCNVPIEKAEGCNHMTCTRCRTHICWTCLQTFPEGNGIYAHMREVHGGIGLAP